jgi:hypothetical protein
MLLKDLDTPKFSGNLEEYMDWRIGLRQFMDLVAPDRGTLTDAVKLEVLNRALDGTNRSIPRAHREKGGGFEEFMQTLDSRYLSDVQEYHRRRWNSLTFPHPTHISQEDLREFRAQFERCRNRVLDSTAEEEYTLLMTKLPGIWREKVVAEEEKRNKGRFWLRVGRIADYTREEVEEFLTAKAGERPRQLKEREGHFLAQFDLEEARTEVLVLHGKKVNGHAMAVSRYRSKMSAMDILGWMEAKLQIAETAQALGGMPTPRVRMVSEEDNKKKESTRWESAKESPRNYRREQKDSNKGGNKGGKGRVGGKGKGKGKGSTWEWSPRTSPMKAQQPQVPWWTRPATPPLHTGSTAKPQEVRDKYVPPPMGGTKMPCFGPGSGQQPMPRSPLRNDTRENFTQWGVQSSGQTQETQKRSPEPTPMLAKAPQSPTQGSMSGGRGQPASEKGRGKGGRGFRRQQA